MKQPEEWSRYAERILASGERPHFAPEPRTLAVHARVLTATRARLGRTVDALVLGATPELADLALEAGCRVQRVDCNPTMFVAARKRQVRIDRAGETCHVADWLDMAMVADASIDVVLGDNALNNVAHHQMRPLLSELARITRRGGVLSLRQHVLPDGPMPASLEIRNVVDRFRAGAFGAHEFSKILRFACFVDAVWEPERRLLDAERVFALIDAAHRTGVLNDEEHAFMDGRRSRIQHTIYRHQEQRALLEALGPCRIEQGGPAADFDHVFAVWVVDRT